MAWSMTVGDLEIRDAHDIPLAPLLELYKHADWASWRTAEGIKASLARTSLLLTGWHEGRCVAMIRVMTDGLYRAAIDDVIVLPEFQKRGWGKVMMDAALGHPLVRDVEEVALFTVIPAFYEKLGFQKDAFAMKLKRPRPGKLSGIGLV